jgi:hypothetical protein
MIVTVCITLAVIFLILLYIYNQDNKKNCKVEGKAIKQDEIILPQSIFVDIEPVKKKPKKLPVKKVSISKTVKNKPLN